MPSPIKVKTIIDTSDEQKYQFQLPFSSPLSHARNKTSVISLLYLTILITFSSAVYFVYVKTFSNALKQFVTESTASNQITTETFCKD